MKIVLFGNRGSRPIGASYDSPFERFGGDTTSVGLLCDDGALIALDTGSGFWKWQYTLDRILARKAPYEIDVFYSHYHDDHTMGIAQSSLLFQPGNHLRFYGPNFDPGLRDVFNAMANRPANPDLSKVYQALMSFTDLPENAMIKKITLRNGTEVQWMPVQHGSEKAYGYRITHNGQSVCFISDTHHDYDSAKQEHIINQDIVDFIRGADILIYDSHFTDQEFERNPGLCQAFGHSTGEHGVRLAELAGVPIYIKHHHDPAKIDVILDKETDNLKLYGSSKNVNVIAAQPSICIDLGLPPAQRVPFVNNQANPANRYQAIAL